MNRFLRVSLATLLLIPTADALHPPRQYHHAQEEAIIQGIERKEAQKRLRQAIWELEDYLIYEQQISETGKPPTENPKPVTRYSPTENTKTIFDYPTEGINTVLQLKDRTITYEIPEQLIKELNEGNNNDFPTTNWRATKKRNKIKIYPPKSAKEYLMKIYLEGMKKMSD